MCFLSGEAQESGPKTWCCRRKLGAAEIGAENAGGKGLKGEVDWNYGDRRKLWTTPDLSDGGLWTMKTSTTNR